MVEDARTALATESVAPVFKWIRPADESTVREVFDKAIKVRKIGAAARELADMHFFETLVRLHRASEGAPYTGLKPAGTDPGPVVRAADSSLENGSVDALAENVAQHAAEGIRKRFTRANQARKHKDDNVQAGREFVGAYVEYVHYVENLHKAVAGHDGHKSAETASDGANEHDH